MDEWGKERVCLGFGICWRLKITVLAAALTGLEEEGFRVR